MSYSRQYLGQDEDVIWSNVDWSIPGGGAEAIYTPSTNWENIDWTKSQGAQITPRENYPYTTLPSQDSGWWSGLKDWLVPISTATSNIIRAMTGQPVPPGSKIDPRTGQVISPYSTAQSWLIPALLVGGGILLVARMKK